jgi:hypothetical protein
MKSRTLQAFLIPALVATNLGALAPFASAGDIYHADGNDTKGPLDLASVRLTEVSGADRFQVKTLAKFTAKQLDGDKGWIEVDFDTDADRTIDIWVVVYYYKGKLFAIEGHGSSAIRKLPARRADARTVSFDIKHDQLGHMESYGFDAASIWRASPCSRSKPCVDTIPNRFPLLLHDFTPPSLVGASVPTYSTDVSLTLTFPLTFKLADDPNGTGLKSWTLQRRMSTATTWETLTDGNTTKSTVDVLGEEGTNEEFRVLAVDKQGNKATFKLGKTAVPFDDGNSAIIYSSSTQIARSTAFLGTVTQLANGETATFTFTPEVGFFCVLIGHPETSGAIASAKLEIDGFEYGTFAAGDGTGDVFPLCEVLPSGVSHTAVLTGMSAEPYVIDGMVAR